MFALTDISWITVIWSMGAAACLTLSVIYFVVWFTSRIAAHMWFALTAVSFAVYALFELQVLFAQTPQQLDAVLRWAQIPLSLGLVALTVFVWRYLDAGRPWLAWSIAGVRTIYVLPSLLLGGNPILREIPSLQQMQFLGESVTLNKGIPTRWGLIGLFTVLLILIFVVDASLTAWRRGERRKARMVGGSAVSFLLVALATGTLISWSDLKIPLANSLYYQALVAMMGYELSRDVLRASQLAHDLRASEARSQGILRAVPDLMFLQSMDGIYLDYHAARLDQLFAPPDDFLGKNMRDVLPPAVLTAVVPAFVEAAGAVQTVVAVEYELSMAHGNRIYEARLVRSDHDQILTLVRDVTDSRRSEAALRDSQQRYSLAASAGAVGVWDWNFETSELFVDPGLKSLLGFDDGEISTRPDDWGSRVHPQDRALAAAGVKNCIDGITDTYEIEHRMVHKDGRVRWMLSRGSALRGADGRLRRLVGTKVDITERKFAEQLVRENQASLEASNREIQDLAGRLIAYQEVERARIARDLHDDFSQHIAGLSIALSGLKRRLGELPGAGDLPDEVAALQQRAIGLAENIRNLSHDLHPSVLEHAGLVAALNAYCADLARRQALSIAFTAAGDFDSTSTAAALCLYRVAQEGLRNVVTHAHAARAELRLRRVNDHVELTIVDDGRGFDIVSAGRRGRGLGLVSINERARLAGGTASIVTELNKGTRVRVQIPANEHTAYASPN